MIVNEEIDKAAEPRTINPMVESISQLEQKMLIYFTVIFRRFKVSVDIKPGIIITIGRQVVEKQLSLGLLIELMKDTVTLPLMEL